ncbi:MAG TPA: transglycosylase SLT domain-containing protein [Thermoanaerobaculia bacterium]|nr:transglycosylase SLT domain-containing protein [Thermoanaerobaculia bacterium]
MLAPFLLVLCSTFAIQAELVVFRTGDVLKVSAYEIERGDLLVELAAGGRMRMPLRRVERILADEIVAPTEPEVAVPSTLFEIDFLESHPVPEAPFGPLIHEASRRHRVNPLLVAAMVRCESAFDEHAISPRGARGLLQLMPATAERFGVDPVELADPARNLEAGVRYLRWLADRFDNDLPRVLAAFNSGEGTVDRYRGIPPYRETRDYVRRIYRVLGLPSHSHSSPAL